ncbi:MAG: flap endonuclease-1 [Hadesarchaea archaeon]|nr:flap endonuclease-1 [Hadesarchaea archaeon]
MGVQLGDVVPRKEISLEELRGKVIAIDAMNTLYQFLSIIRQRDGEPLKDSKGRVTSHLSGLFYRTANLIGLGIWPVFVFDGEPPKLKSRTLKERRTIRAEAERAYKEALEAGDIVEARKQAQRAARLTKEMAGEAMELLRRMGVAYIQAPGEGEAQAARLVQLGDAWAVASQDFDSLLFGAPVLVRNVAITGRRKMPGKDVYAEITPEFIELQEMLKKFEIDRRGLIAVGILVGTDYNRGVKGIGPKKALKLVKEHGSIEEIIRAGVAGEFDVDPLEVEKIFLNPNVTNDYELKWSDPDPDGIKEFLCEEHDFSESRVQTGIDRLFKGARTRMQESLEKWLG